MEGDGGGMQTEISLDEIEAGGGYVTVPRALLSLCSDLLRECDKHMPITGSNFDDDMGLARAQLREFLKE